MAQFPDDAAETELCSEVLIDENRHSSLGTLPDYLSRSMQENVRGFLRSTGKGDVSIIQTSGFMKREEPLPEAGASPSVVDVAVIGDGARMINTEQVQLPATEVQPRLEAASTAPKQKSKASKVAFVRQWHEGKVVNLNKKKPFGFITPTNPLPEGFTARDVFFRLQDGPDNNLIVGEDVKFGLIAGSAAKPAASVVLRLSDTIPETDTTSRRKSHDTVTTAIPHAGVSKEFVMKDLYHGEICQVVDEKKFGYIRRKEALPDCYPVDKDIHFQLDKVRCAGITVVEGDEVEFSLGTKDKSRPKAFNITALKLKNRSLDQMLVYIDTVSIKLKSLGDTEDEQLSKETRVQKVATLMELISIPAVWQCIGSSLAGRTSNSTAFKCVELVLLFAREAKSIRSSIADAIDVLCKTTFLDSNHGGFAKLLKQINSDRLRFRHHFSKCKEFMLLVVGEAPKRARCIAALLKNVISHEEDSLELFLLSSMQVLAKNKDDGIDDLEWNELPLVPVTDELIRTRLEDTVSCSPVRVSGPYDSVEQYIDTYFRLFRAECFGALQNGIQDLLRGQLDSRDMNVYHSIKLVGIQFRKSNDGMVVALHLAPSVEVKNWETTTKLMYGNLLCISMSGTFTDPIWATVAQRDAKVLKETGVIYVDLCSSYNRYGDAEVILMLSQASAHALIAESPTYYKAFEPVMKALQSFDSSSFPFAKELVECSFDSMESPIYLQEAQEADWSHVLMRHPKKTSLRDFMRRSLDEATYLDRFQLVALRQCFDSTIAVIQGPPGTGKTFIGIKIVQTLLSMSSLPESPILVLTYKNHALDEFLKSVLNHFPKDVLRIGGRSKDEMLVSSTFHEVQKTAKKPKELNALLYDKYVQLDDAKRNLIEATQNLDSKRSFCHYTFLGYLSQAQTEMLLRGCKTSLDKDDIINEMMKHDGDIMKAKLHQKESELDTLIHQSIKQWLPGQTKFKEFEKDFEKDIRFEKSSKKQGSQSDEDLLDEDDVKREEEERMASGSAKTFDTKDILKLRHSGKDNQPYLMNCAKQILKQAPIPHILNEPDMWKLSVRNRILLVQYVLLKESEKVEPDFETKLVYYQRLCMEKAAIDDEHKANVIRSKKVVGMTITGAAMHHELLRLVKPEIILVEEAAELLETHILAVLGPWVKHLILIGDHKQLRPNVSTHLLSKKYNFDVSLMERLINNGIPHKSLGMQNRMRPEFAELLLDIYPELRSNRERVSKNVAAACIAKPMFFWDHEDPETSGRSYKNIKEAERVIRLTLFLIQQGYLPSQITIIAAYQGQVAELRRRLREEESRNSHLFKQYDVPGNEDQKQRVVIHTIDMYQGDENDFVIVSLVRSYSDGKLKGFLNLINRRCVAQSRAKCGLYFVGNSQLMQTNGNWKTLIQKMKAEDCVGRKIPLKCPRHPSSAIHAENSIDITLQTFCHVQCSQKMECQQHPCGRQCQPPHDHTKCQVKVGCDLECGHFATKQCWQNESSITCKENCSRLMKCGVHQCSKKCHPQHLHSYCSERVEFNFKACGHRSDKHCSEDEKHLQCKADVYFTFSQCKHLGKRMCFQKDSDITCKEPCTKTLGCGHPCSLKCGEPCLNSLCTVCRKLREIEAKKKLELEKELQAKAREKAEQEYNDLRAKPIDEMTIVTEILPRDETAAEYYKVEDMVKRYVQPSHNWFPEVTKIEKVFNCKQQLKWLERMQQLYDPTVSDMKFHGTSSDAVDNIVKEGFKLPSKPGMYGRGIYFATDSSKSAQSIYTKGSNKLLLCEVLLGRSKTVDRAIPHMDLRLLNLSQHDSVYAKRGTRATKGVLYDEFVVYDPDQAIVRYIIHYITVDPALAISSRASSAHLPKVSISPKRHLDLKDENDIHFRVAESQFLRLMSRSGQKYQITSVDLYSNKKLMQKFDMQQAEMKKKYPTGTEAEMILAFHGTKPANIPNIMDENFKLSLLSANTGDMGYYGAGIYFSEFPDVSLGYGSNGAIILCQVLPGKSYDCPGLMTGAGLQPGFDSHRYAKDSEGRGKELVIFNPDQILPRYVINFK